MGEVVLRTRGGGARTTAPVGLHARGGAGPGARAAHPAAAGPPASTGPAGPAAGHMS